MDESEVESYILCKSANEGSISSHEVIAREIDENDDNGSTDHRLNLIETKLDSLVADVATLQAERQKSSTLSVADAEYLLLKNTKDLEDTRALASRLTDEKQVLDSQVKVFGEAGPEAAKSDKRSRGRKTRFGGNHWRSRKVPLQRSRKRSLRTELDKVRPVDSSSGEDQAAQGGDEGDATVQAQQSDSIAALVPVVPDPQAAMNQVREWRHKLQKAFLSTKGPPKKSEMPAMNDLFTQIEQYGDRMTVEQLSYSKIVKVLRHITALDPTKDRIPRDEEFKFRERSTALVNKWNSPSPAGETGRS
ncbi:hypothetical protein MPER_03925 [Moniliophthora perniciosa FA553]|nr:hypothetical protein MPER_03925 [Moniliophthora perniciosa FA553]